MSATIEVDVTDPTPAYEQIRRRMVSLISLGELAASQRLPTVRQLAADLGLAAGTVARAYRELEQSGWIVSRRGGGTRVTDRPPQVLAESDGALSDLAGEFVLRARALGADDVAINAAVALRLGGG